MLMMAVPDDYKGDRLLKQSEVAEILQISLKELYRLRNLGKLKPVCPASGKRRLFYRQSDVEKYIRKL